MTIKIKCRKCNGTGFSKLDEALLETLAVVKELGGATAVQVQKRIDPKREKHTTAFNNRLNDLHELGLVTMRTHGRVNIYTAVSRK